MWAVLAEILAKLLPVIAEWLISLLKKQAKALDKAGVQSLGSDVDNARALLQDALDATKPRQVMRRLAIKKALEVLPQAVASKSKVTGEDKAELKTLLLAAE